jgi:hypothetical protein
VCGVMLFCVLCTGLSALTLGMRTRTSILQFLYYGIILCTAFQADALRVTLREAEEQERRQALEMRRLREELAAAQGRVVAALQAVQVANAEADALRASATTAVHDEQVCASPLVPLTAHVPRDLVTSMFLVCVLQAHSGAVQAALQRIQILGEYCCGIPVFCTHGR